MLLPALSMSWDPLHILSVPLSTLVFFALGVLLYAPSPLLLLCPQYGMSPHLPDVV